MAERTDLVIAVDQSQIKSAAEALKTLGFEATLAESASSKLAKTATDAGKSIAGAAKSSVGAVKELSSTVAKTAGDMERLAGSAKKTDFVISVDQSQVKSATEALKALGFQASAIAETKLPAAVVRPAASSAIAATSIAPPATSTAANLIRGLDEAELEIARTKTALIDLSNATTSLGATAPVEKLTSALKNTNVAALEAARAMIQAREAEEALARQTAGLTIQDAVPGIKSQRPAGPSDLVQINSFLSAADRAEERAENLGRTLSRSIGAGADSASESIKDLSRATTSLGASSNIDFDRVTTSLGAAAAKAQEASNEVNRLKVNLSQLDSAGTSLGARSGPTQVPSDLRGQFQAADVSKSAENQALLARLAGGATAALENQSKAVAKNTHAHDGHWKSVRRSAYEQQQLAYQLHDFTIQILGGQSPFLALVQQGSQLAGTFGGIRGAISAVTALITPTVAAVGGLVVAVGGFALALASVESSARGLNTLQTQFEATGRAGEFTDSQLKKLIQTLQLLPGVSKGAATSIVSEFSKAHEVSGALATQLSSLVVDFARATGQDLPTAAKQLADGFSDPVRGAKLLEQALGALRSEEILLIRSLTLVGDKAGAQAVLLQALERAVKGLANTNRTDLEKSINDLGNAWDKMMRSMDQSEGLKNANSSLGIMLGWLRQLVEYLPEFEKKWASAFNGGLNGAVMRLMGVDTDANSRPRNQNPTASGPVTGFPDVRPQAGLPGAAAAARAVPDNDKEIKDALRLGEAYRSLGGQIDDLSKKRDVLAAGAAKAVKDYGAESKQALSLRDSVSAINEQIAQLRKRQQSNSSQGNQVEDLILKDRLNSIKDALSQTRDAISTQERLLQSAYQLGETSLKDTFDKRVELIRQGTEAQVKAIDDQISALQDRLRDPKIDPVRRQRFTEQIDDLDREKVLIKSRSTNDERQANDQLRVSYQQLKEQVESYRIELLQLQGDEAGAAQAQAEQVIRRAQILAGQSARSGLPAVDVNTLRQALDQQNALNRAKEATGLINERLNIQEDSINRLARTGAISELGAMQQISTVRQQSVVELEKIVKGMEEVAALTQNRDNWRLQLDTAQAREALEQLKAEIDPLKEKFDNMFRDGASGAIADFLDGTRTAKEALNDFGKSILKTMNDIISKEISHTLFGKDGIFGGAGGFLAKVFGGKNNTSAEAAASATSSVQSIAPSLKGAADPAAASLNKVAAAADSAANSLNKVGSGSGTGGSNTSKDLRDFGVLTNDRATELANSQSGDSLDNLIGIKGGFGTLPSGEQSVFDQFRVASDETATTTEDFGKTLASAGSDVLKLASAATQGGGALSILPSIISAISASASTVSSSGGGGLLGGFMSLFSGGGGYSAVDQAGLDTLIATFHTGGVAGQPSAMKQVNSAVFAGATKYHSGGTVLGNKQIPGLKSDEVPVILLRNEEVLTRNDPRHRANLDPDLLQQLQEGGSSQLREIKIAGRRAWGGSVSRGSMYEVNERGPEVLTVGNRQYLMMGSKNGSVTPNAGSASRGGDTNLHVTVTPPAGGSRESAMQWGATAGRQMQHALRRNG